MVGQAPGSDTLGFRWSAVNNLFATAAELGGEEWKASHSVDEDNAERERRQFVWCLPVVPNKWTDSEIQVHELACRVGPYPRGIAPVGTKWITAAIDLGKYLDHWIAVAWTDGPYAHVVDYGRIEVATDDMGVEQASILALRQSRNMILQGWPMGAVGGEVKVPHLVLADAGYMTDVVYSFCRESGNRFLPSVGLGATQQYQRHYSQITQTGSTVVHTWAKASTLTGYHARMCI